MTEANTFDFEETGPFYLDLELPKASEVAEPKKSGRKKHEVWNYFIEEETRKFGHSSSACVYCGKTWDRGRVSEMMAHLALQCESVESSVKEQYLRELASGTNSSSTKKRKLDEEITKGIQPKITSKLQKSTIDPGQRSLCNRSLTRFFVCCGIPFSTVENPFFIDLIKNLCAGYQLPDRRTLSDTWLNNEVARVIVDIEEILKKQENLSLGKIFLVY